MFVHSVMLGRFWRPAFLLVVAVVIQSATVSQLAASDGKIEPVEKWSNVFSGEEIVQRFRFPNNGANGQAVGWSVALETAVIARGESVLKADPQLGPLLTIELRLPEGEPKVILPLTIFIAHHGENVQAKRLWIFPRNPFSQPIPKITASEIVLFDPQRTTAVRLEESQLKFRLARNVDALTNLRDGVLLIGSGVSFREHRALPNALLQAAANGVKVVCLTPMAGIISLPDDDGVAGHDEQKPVVLRNLSLKRADFIAELDKRLDYRDWRGKSPVVASTVLINGKGNKLTADISTEERGWPWMEAEFSNGGRLIVCGFSIIEQWEAGPTPRYLLWHVLSHAAGNSKVPVSSELRTE